MKYFQFRKGAKEDKPTFKFGDETTNKITGKLKWIFFNEPKNVTTKEWKSVTIPANVNVVFDNEQSVAFSIELWGLFRSTMNSFLSANIWDAVEMYTYVNKKGYKTISITNPTIKDTIFYNNKDTEVNQSYKWAYDMKSIPEVEVITNKKGEFVSADDSEANEFFVNKIKEKFGKQESTWTEINLEDIPFS